MTQAALTCCLLVVCGAAMRGEEIDRVAVSIDNTVLTESEVIRQIRITSFLNGQQPEFSADARRERAEQLVNQALIRREISSSNYQPVSADKAQQLFEAFRKRHGSEQDWSTLLTRYKLSDQDVRDAFIWQATFLEFVEVRFRPGVSIPEDEIRTYFDAEVKGKSSPGAELSFEEARPRVEEVLIQQRVDSSLDRWLGQMRTQSRILYRQEAFQ